MKSTHLVNELFNNSLTNLYKTIKHNIGYGQVAVLDTTYWRELDDVKLMLSSHINESIFEITKDIIRYNLR